MDIKVPAVGESVYEGVIARWLKKSGERVSKDEPLCEVETDKITVEINADAAGILTTLADEGETVKIGAVIGRIEEQGAEGAAPSGEPEARPAAGAEARPVAGAEAKAVAGAEAKPAPEGEAKPAAGGAAVTPVAGAAEEKPVPAQAQPVPGGTEAQPVMEPTGAGAPRPVAPPPMSPSGRKLAREMGVEPHELTGSGRGGRVTREDLLRGGAPAAAPALEEAAPPAQRPPQEPQTAAAPQAAKGAMEEPVTRKAMSPIRKRIAERLVAAKQQTAMLTTFNEADMSAVLQLRKKYGEQFMKRHNVKLGFMSLFTRACCEALKEFPEVNASIEGDDIVYHNYCDIGIAIGGEKGLVVPVLRRAETMTFAEIEQSIMEMTAKVAGNKLALADLEGGTFTISNGGIYGSLLSTPILNPPQSGVLGMHAIQERAVVRDGEIVIRPMMYLALSYDHRIVDGKGAVGFLKRVKEYIEQPEEMLLES